MYPHGWNILYILLLFIVWLDLNIEIKLLGGGWVVVVVVVVGRWQPTLV